MKIRSKTLLAGLAGALCLFAFVISPVSASGMMGMGADNGHVTDCVGDCDQIREQTRNQTCEQIHEQTRNQTCEQIGNQTCEQTRNQTCDQQMGGRLSGLEEQGINAAEIRAALETGDLEEVRALMQNFVRNVYRKGMGIAL